MVNEPKPYVVDLSTGTVTGGPAPGIVQHWNRVTFELEVHEYAPDSCDRCADLATTAYLHEAYEAYIRNEDAGRDAAAQELPAARHHDANVARLTPEAEPWGREHPRRPGEGSRPTGFITTTPIGAPPWGTWLDVTIVTVGILGAIVYAWWAAA